MVQTIVRENEYHKTLQCTSNVYDKVPIMNCPTAIEIVGQTGERGCCEDRPVLVRITVKGKECVYKCSIEDCITDWLKGEQALELAQGMLSWQRSLLWYLYNNANDRDMPIPKAVMPVIASERSVTYMLSAGTQVEYLRLSVNGGPSKYLHLELHYTDVIQLAEMLLAAGTFALTANMINHQKVHMARELQDWINAKKVNKIVMECLPEIPMNYGDGFKVFRIYPVFVSPDKITRYEREWYYDTVKYWSPFPDDFQKQKKAYKVPIQFVGFDWKEWHDNFERSCAESEQRTAEGSPAAQETKEAEHEAE